jgi:hypothetical protein
MANNPTTNKQLNRPDYNDQNWNTPLNNSTSIIDQCFGTTVTPAQTGTNTYALAFADIQNMRVNLTGSLSATGTVTIPATYGGFWIISNNTTGGSGYNVNVKVATGSNLVSVKNGYSTIVFSNGSECFDSEDQKLNVTGGTITGNLTVNNGAFALQSSAVSKLTYDPTAGSPQLYVTGSIYATGNITAFSDERLKHNVHKIDDALELCRAMEGVRFEDKDGNKYVGLIAQNVQKAVPEAVILHEESGYLSVAYQNLVGVLVNAINDLTARVEELEKK